jgi:DHA2 family multidrug resistance protein
MNYDATTAGFILAVGGLVTLVVMPLADQVTGRLVQSKWLILVALAGTGWHCFRARDSPSISASETSRRCG